MNRALIYLVSRSLVNAIAFRLRRLKQPKYLAGALFGALYFYFYLFRFLIRGGQPSREVPAIPIGELGVEIGSLVLFGVVIIFSWLWPGSRAALHFTEAEIAWLFPAPLDRPTLIRFKLLKTQLSLLFLSLVMTLITGRASLGPQVWMHLAGWWIIFSTLQMHRLGASFALQRLTQRGLSDWKRRAAVIAGVLTFAGAIYFWKIATPNLPRFTESHESLDWLRALLHAGPAPWLLLPFRAVVQPWFALDFTTFLSALPAALSVMGLHYFWVIRAHVSFEEASVAFSQKRAAFLAARRSGDLRVKQAQPSANIPAFRLGPTGFEPVSFVWKHLLSSGGRRSLRQWLVGGALALAITSALSPSGRWPIAPVIIAIVAISVFLMVTLTNAAHGARAVRRDLLAIDLLKTFPIPGWKIVLGELLGPVLGCTALQILALIIIVMSISSVPELPEAKRQLLPIAACAIALLVPAINLTLMIIPTAATLLFPAWFKSGEAVTPGLETMGLRIITALGQLLALLLALIPAAILGGVAWMSAEMLGASAIAIFAGAGVATITLSIEASMGVVLLGRVFDGFDPSEES